MLAPGPAKRSAKLLQDLLVLRESPDLVFGEDQSAVDLDVEDPVITGYELGLAVHGFLDLGRQTGGRGEVVSTPAVGDGDLHGMSLLR